MKTNVHLSYTSTPVKGQETEQSENEMKINNGFLNNKEHKYSQTTAVPKYISPLDTIERYSIYPLFC